MSDNDKLIADIQSDNNALIKKLDQLDERIAELERHNQLLRAIGERVQMNMEYMKRHGMKKKIDDWRIEEMQFIVDELFHTGGLTQAAIDGGALDKDGEK